MKKVIIALAFLIPTVTIADTDIIIDKKKNGEVLYQQKMLGMGNMSIDDFFITAAKEGFVTFNGKGLSHNNYEHKKYDFSAKVRQTEELVIFKDLKLTNQENENAFVKINGNFNRESIKSSESFFDVLKNSGEYSLNLTNKGNGSEILLALGINDMNELEVEESISLTRKNDEFSVENISIDIKDIFSFQMTSNFNITNNIVLFKNGTIKYSLMGESSLSKKLKEIFNLKDTDVVDLANESIDLSKF